MKWLGKPLSAGLGEANWLLFFLGVGMIVLAVIVIPGTQSGAASLLIVLGAGAAVAGILAAPFSQLEIGPTGIKVSREANTSTPTPWLAAEATTLSQVAQVVLGNPKLAREVVEDVISRMARHRKEIPRSRFDLTAFRTLVAFLRRAENQRWLNGFRGDHGRDRVQTALRDLPFDTRIAFALSLEFPESDVAEILGCSEQEIATEVSAARAAVAPHLEQKRESTDD